MNIAKGHIYIIFCNVNPKIYYVGSTFNELKQRWNSHKKGKSCSINKYINEYGIENFTLKLIKSYDVYREHKKDTKHLRAWEQLWINKFRNSCNQVHSFNPLQKVKKKESNRKWREEHIEEVLRKQKINGKIYNEKNKEKRKEPIKCECGNIISKYNIARHIKTKKHQDYIKNNNNPSFAQY